ncbi:hypothetical protein [Yoonia sp. 2307UL14-13]|uniref:hypothetical protein n=1 Tax=Yoonia sp. 2307UL14-13 TaxID=3126506 RepID=UPI0030A681F2
MKNKLFLMVFAPLAIAGCAEQILSQEEVLVIGADAATNLSVAPKRQDDSLLGEASRLASELSSAYFTAGIRASRTQDLVNTGVYLAAGSTAIGALGGATDTALTNRALAGVGLQSIGQNGLEQSEIQSLFMGAGQLNCIGSVTSIYSSTSSDLADSPIAQDLANAAMQDVRISTRNALVRDVEGFGEVLQTFTNVLPTVDDEAELGRVVDDTPPAPLEAFAAKLGACISSK